MLIVMHCDTDENLSGTFVCLLYFTYRLPIMVKFVSELDGTPASYCFHVLADDCICEEIENLLEAEEVFAQHNSTASSEGKN